VIKSLTVSVFRFGSNFESGMWTRKLRSRHLSTSLPLPVHSVEDRESWSESLANISVGSRMVHTQELKSVARDPTIARGYKRVTISNVGVKLQIIPLPAPLNPCSSINVYSGNQNHSIFIVNITVSIVG
jgi:hypothetical protein